MVASRWMVTGSWGTTERHNDGSQECVFVRPSPDLLGGSAGGRAVKVGPSAPACGGR